MSQGLTKGTPGNSMQNWAWLSIPHTDYLSLLDIFRQKIKVIDALLSNVNLKMQFLATESLEHCYVRNITIFKSLRLLKLRNKDNGMFSFGFVLLSLVLTLIQNYRTGTISNEHMLFQLLQQRHRNRFSNSVSAFGQVIVRLVIDFCI